jgi:Tol biopolymer transport system component
VDEISDIYVIRVSGGKPDRLTSDSAQDGSPMWSRDGMWIYFSSNRTGRREVWKVSAEAGKAVQVTRSGGETPCESPDGRSIYYTKGGAPPGLWEMPVSGGGESQVLPSIGDDYCLVSEGIYFVPEPGADGKYCIQFLSFATGKVRTVAPISGSPISDRLSVSPDGRFILHSLEDEVRIDLMLIENFR